MKPIASLAIFLSLIVAVVAPSHAAKRVALVVGNSTYQHTPALPNPRNDARDMAVALKRLGFEVQLGIDLDESEFARAVRAFSRKATGAETSLFYYAGHGLQYEGNNYLVPVDARLTDEAALTFEALKLNDVLRLMERASQVSLVFLDACRDNPLARNLAGRLGPGRSAAVGRGLAVVENVVGTLIAFATQPGNVAQDGDGRNSPFTKALLKRVETPGLDISQLLRLVRDDVIADTRGLQVPWDHSSLKGGAFYMSPPVSEPTAAFSGGASISLTAQHEVAFWETIRDSENPDFFREYLWKFPNGAFGGLAKIRIAELSSAPTNEEQSSQVAEHELIEPEPQQAALPEPKTEFLQIPEGGKGGRDGRWQASNKDWRAQALIRGSVIELEFESERKGLYKGSGSISADGTISAALNGVPSAWNRGWASGSLEKLEMLIGRTDVRATFVFRRVKTD